MSLPAPHFLLISEAAPRAARAEARASAEGRWRFVLQTAGGQTHLEAADDEPEPSTERLQLLAIVRGLEALDEPARVTLVAAGRSISRGLRYGIAQWRESDWQWERYGKLAPIKNADLWRRIDRAMAIHTVECQPSASDAVDDLAEPAEPVREPADVRVIRRSGGRTLRFDSGSAAKDNKPAAESASRPPRARATHWLARFVRTMLRIPV